MKPDEGRDYENVAESHNDGLNLIMNDVKVVYGSQPAERTLVHERV